MKLIPVPVSQKTELRRGMFTDHQIELSAYDGLEPGPDGTFPYPAFELYWTEPDRRFPFWIIADSERAGMVFLRIIKKEESPISMQTLQLAEFYIEPRFRGSGLAQQALDAVAERAAKLEKPLTWTCYACNDPGNRCYARALERLRERGFYTRTARVPRRAPLVEEILYLAAPPAIRHLVED